MGIPRLASTLQPYAVNGFLRDRDAVVDGPALAHHILHQCWAGGIGHPSYDLLGRSAIAWLDELARHRVCVDAIYFDGALPIEKRPVRMERLAKGFAQLSHVFSSNPRACPRSFLYPGTRALPDLFSLSPPSSARRSPPSFLVPAIIDALRLEPRYGHLVHVVPGEADASCAQRAALTGACILTSDSDLLAHDLGTGCVVFLAGVYRNADSELVCSILAPDSISRKLGLSSSGGVRRVAYERRQSLHAPISELVRRCSVPPSDEKGYHEFCQQYLHLDPDPVPQLLNGDTASLEGLDPRLSELVVQLGTLNHKGEDAEASGLKVFLPALVDNPSRGTAWEPSAPIRRLAYSVAAWATQNPAASLQEYRRVQETAQRGRHVDLIPAASAEKPIGDLANLMRHIRATVAGDVDLYWSLVCLALDIRDCQDQEKNSFVLLTLQQSGHGPASLPNEVSWDLVHFVAHLQASYYSLRMLKQAVSVLPEESWGSLPPGLLDLRDMLSDFPPLVDFPDVNSTLSWLATTSKRRILDMLRQFVDVPEAPHTSSNKAPRGNGTGKKKKQKKKRKSQQKNRAETTGSSTGNPAASAENIFNLLSVER